MPLDLEQIIGAIPHGGVAQIRDGQLTWTAAICSAGELITALKPFTRHFIYVFYGNSWITQGESNEGKLS
jgi:hypothetical protein